MGKIYYKKSTKRDKRKAIKLLSFGMFLIGALMVAYVFFPLLSWQIYFQPAFANQSIKSPIPNNTLVSNLNIQSLISQAGSELVGIDYTNVDNWFPTFKYQENGAPKTRSYKISIPSIKIKNAVVSTVDGKLSEHLVNYGGTAIPFEKGNAVVFGHSTLPQLYDSKSYKTVFSNLYKLSPGDEIVVTVDKKSYKYNVESITVVDPNNTTVLEQNYNDSFLTLITCTPPGTIWKRLVVKSRIQKA